MLNLTFKSLCFKLIILAAIIVSLRLIYFSSDIASGDKLWQLTVDAAFEAENKKSNISISTPGSTPYNRLIRQSITHPGLRIRNDKPVDDVNHEIRAVAIENGPLSLSAEFHIHQSSTPSIQITKTILSTDLTELYLKNDDAMDLDHPDVTALVNKLTERSEDRSARLLQIHEYCRSLKNTDKNQLRSVRDIIKHKKASAEERVLVFVALARAMKFPARMVTGFILEESLDVKPHYWVEVYDDSSWQPFDPDFGYHNELPQNFMPFSYDSNTIVSLKNGNNLSVDYFLEANLYTVPKTKQNSLQWLSIFDLQQLDLETRSILASLLLLPYGVLITAIFRHFIGIHSYGVFTPTLLALATDFNQWQTTVMILAIIILFSAIGRKIFPKKLSRTPRLSIIFTLVAVSMSFAVSFVDYVMPSSDGYAVLLPIVILTTLIDRFYQTIDTKGLKTSYIRLFWTLIITLVCLPIVQYKPLGFILLEFPELHLLTLTAILFITSYQGKTLTHFIPPILKEPVKTVAAAVSENENKKTEN